MSYNSKTRREAASLAQVKWAHKKYSSHRVVEEWVFADIDSEMEKETK
jgi:hypothetical protein